MDAKELRIGNYVKCKISNDAGIYQVLGIPAWGYGGSGDGKEPLILIDRCPKQLVPESKIKGVRLTTELLEACGLVKNQHGNYSKLFTREGDENDKMVFFVGKEPEFFWFGVQNLILDSVAINTVKYMHQLQNIYYSLTGKELTVNLPVTV